MNEASIDIPTWGWGAFAALLGSLLAIDLFAHRGDRRDAWRGALVWTFVWIGVAIAFGCGVGFFLGGAAAEEFFGAYLIEKALSVDNLFVFLVIFAQVGVPRDHERRVLTWGVLGAIVTRGAFIAIGAALLARWHFVVDVLGVVLIVTGLRMLRPPKDEGTSGIARRLARWIPYSPRTENGRFFVREGGKLLASPLFVALIAIELTDVLFAVDSIPAAFAVTEEPFIVYTSNVFALLGLRSLYVVLARALSDLRYLRHGLVAVLIFAGLKMLAARWIHVSPLVSLAVIVSAIAVAVIASLVSRARTQGLTERRA